MRIPKNHRTEKPLFDGGYVTFEGATPKYHFYVQDHLGNNRAVVSQTGAVEQQAQYYPSGAVMTSISEGISQQPYLYSGKELDRMHALDWYDFGARHYDAALLRWHSMDPLCEKYYHISPYAFCANNFVNAFDPKGDSVAVITNGFHMAMLIQNPQDGQWGYFSINGTNKGWLGFGQPYNNKGEESFSSPEAFIVSQYNKEQPDGDEPVSGYNYDKGYVIGSSKEQDAKMQSAFIDIADNEEYNFFYNNCVTTTQRAMVEGGLNGQPTVAREYEVNLPIRGIVPFVPIIVPIRIPKLSQATPKNVYNYIKHNNFGREINK